MCLASPDQSPLLRRIFWLFGHNVRVLGPPVRTHVVRCMYPIYSDGVEDNNLLFIFRQMNIGRIHQQGSDTRGFHSPVISTLTHVPLQSFFFIFFITGDI